MTADPDRACPHENFQALVEVARITKEEGGPVTGYNAEIRVHCADCDEPFRWIGVQAGMKADRPMCSVDERELRAPIRPASADPDFGLGIPGFAVRLGTGMEDAGRSPGMDTSDPDDHGIVWP
ncbi:MAG: hypothetical protein ACRDXE_10530 [Acidimicrobiales bacterium]